MKLRNLMQLSIAAALVTFAAACGDSSPTVAPTIAPTVAPTAEPTASPTVEPTAAPTMTPVAGEPDGTFEGGTPAELGAFVSSLADVNNDGVLRILVTGDILPSTATPANDTAAISTTASVGLVVLEFAEGDHTISATTLSSNVPVRILSAAGSSVTIAAAPAPLPASQNFKYGINVVGNTTLTLDGTRTSTVSVAAAAQLEEVAYGVHVFSGSLSSEGVAYTATQDVRIPDIVAAPIFIPADSPGVSINGFLENTFALTGGAEAIVLNASGTAFAYPQRLALLSDLGRVAGQRGNAITVELDPANGLDSDNDGVIDNTATVSTGAVITQNTGSVYAGLQLAIKNAVGADTVVAGAGSYIAEGVTVINRPGLTVQSLEGQATTFINAAKILANEVTLGSANAGFSVGNPLTGAAGSNANARITATFGTVSGVPYSVAIGECDQLFLSVRNATVQFLNYVPAVSTVGGGQAPIQICDNSRFTRIFKNNFFVGESAAIFVPSPAVGGGAVNVSIIENVFNRASGGTSPAVVDDQTAADGTNSPFDLATIVGNLFNGVFTPIYLGNDVTAEPRLLDEVPAPEPTVEPTMEPGETAFPDAIEQPAINLRFSIEPAPAGNDPIVAGGVEFARVPVPGTAAFYANASATPVSLPAGTAITLPADVEAGAVVTALDGDNAPLSTFTVQ